jgi:hypothetical protein
MKFVNRGMNLIAPTTGFRLDAPVCLSCAYIRFVADAQCVDVDSRNISRIDQDTQRMGHDGGVQNNVTLADLTASCMYARR